MRRLHVKNPECPVSDEICDGKSLALASSECLHLLLRLCFDRDEARELLTEVSSSPPSRGLRIGVIYRRILAAAETHPSSRSVVEQSIASKLAPFSADIEGRPLCDMAGLWRRRRESIDSLTAAAILWQVARSPLPCWRLLESDIIDDFYYRCVRALALSPSPPAGTGECIVCSVGSLPE